MPSGRRDAAADFRSETHEASKRNPYPRRRSLPDEETFPNRSLNLFALMRILS